MHADDPETLAPALPSEPDSSGPGSTDYGSVDFDPDIFQPRFEIWVPGATGTLFLPASDPRYIVNLGPGGIEVLPGRDATLSMTFRVWVPVPWPATTPIRLAPEIRRPKPKRAVILYIASKAKITTVELWETRNTPSDKIASTTVNWTGFHNTGLDSDNMAYFTLARQPTFGLYVAIKAKFETTDLSSRLLIASVGLDFRIPAT